jgi:hypothetical protein
MISFVGSGVSICKGRESTEGDGAATGDEGREICRFSNRLLDFLSLDLDGVCGVEGSWSREVFVDE